MHVKIDQNTETAKTDLNRGIRPGDTIARESDKNRQTIPLQFAIRRRYCSYCRKLQRIQRNVGTAKMSKLIT